MSEPAEPILVEAFVDDDLPLPRRVPVWAVGLIGFPFVAAAVFLARGHGYPTAYFMVASAAMPMMFDRSAKGRVDGYSWRGQVVIILLSAALTYGLTLASSRPRFEDAYEDVFATFPPKMKPIDARRYYRGGRVVLLRFTTDSATLEKIVGTDLRESTASFASTAELWRTLMSGAATFDLKWDDPPAALTRPRCWSKGGTRVIWEPTTSEVWVFWREP